MAAAWLSGAVLLVLVAVVRATLLPNLAMAAAPAMVAGVWVLGTVDTLSRKALAQVYAPLLQPEALGLLLMLPIAESIFAIRTTLRLADGREPGRPVSRMLAMTPPLSLFAALHLLLAHAYQQVPTDMSFETFGRWLALATFVVLWGAVATVRVLLPERTWRLELHLLLRGVLLVLAFGAHALSTMGPLPAPDASLSLRHTAVVFGGLCGVAATGGLLGPLVAARWRSRSRFRTNLT